MFKHITVCLILASALNCLFLQKINISEVACKKVEEITKDLKKLDQDRKTFGERVNRHIRKYEAQIEALKRKITEKGVQLRKYFVKYQNTKRTKEEELKVQQKICSNKSSLEKQLGTPRTLQASRFPDKKPPRHNKKKKKGKKQKVKPMIVAKVKRESLGKGESTSIALPSGIEGIAHGTVGTKTHIKFKDKTQKSGNNPIVTANTDHKSAFGKTYTSDKKVDAHDKAKGFGQASVGFNRSENFAQITEGTKTGASWKGNTNSNEIYWGQTAYKYHK
jgi:hypothetical protein